MIARDRSRVQDILDHGRRAAKFLGSLDAEALEADDQRFSAVLWCVVVIGEAAGQLSPDLLRTLDDDALQEARRMRNMLIHRYPEIDAARVEVTVREDLPPLLARLEALMRETPE